MGTRESKEPPQNSHRVSRSSWTCSSSRPTQILVGLIHMRHTMLSPLPLCCLSLQEPKLSSALSEENGDSGSSGTIVIPIKAPQWKFTEASISPSLQYRSFLSLGFKKKIKIKKLHCSFLSPFPMPCLTIKGATIQIWAHEHGHLCGNWIHTAKAQICLILSPMWLRLKLELRLQPQCYWAYKMSASLLYELWG